MQTFPQNENIQQWGSTACQRLRNLEIIQASDGVASVLAAMKDFAEVAHLQRQAGVAIEQLTDQDEEMRVWSVSACVYVGGCACLREREEK